MSKDPATFDEAVWAAERARMRAVKAAKQTLNATITTSYVEVIERAWGAYDAAVQEAWDAHDATIRTAREAAEHSCVLAGATDSV
jgi:hypothetical protein